MSKQAKSSSSTPLTTGIDFWALTSPTTEFNVKWQPVVDQIRLCQKGDYSLAVQMTTLSNRSNTFVLVPEIRDVHAFVICEVGELDPVTIGADPQINQWWLQKNGHAAAPDEIFEYIEDQDDLDDVVIGLLAPHFKLPFIQMKGFQDDDVGTDEAPESVGDGGIGESYASLADVLEGVIGNIEKLGDLLLSGKNGLVSICDTKGNLLYGIPWKPIHDESEGDSDEDDETEDGAL